MSAPRIALVDIETAPNLGYVWGMWEQNVIEIEKHWYMLSFAYKWLDEKRVHVRGLCDYPGYKAAKEDDRRLCQDLWRVLDEADICIAHNGDRFDFRKMNARFIEHGLKPPTPFKSIDTLKMARKHFAFDSNKLDSLGQYLGVGRKLPHTGKHLWLGCMAGDPKSWTLMKRYNAHDVELLERVYLRLRPWASTHPRLDYYIPPTNADDAGARCCPACRSTNYAKNARLMLNTGWRQRFVCNDCGHRFTAGPLIKDAA